jgi:two-component system alkaline phosphatase synthesis response regulator PhoP
MHRILVVGASQATSEILDRAARGLGCELEFIEPAESAIMCVESRPDFAVIDNTSSSLEVREICKWLRRQYNDLLVMLLSSQGVRLSQGEHVNMHLIQPFSVRKLTSRFRKMLDIRRTQPLTVGEFTLEPEKHRVVHLGNIVRLTPKEYRLLEFLMRNAGRVLTRRQIMKEVWETDYLGDTRTLDVHISWLREKLEPQPRTPTYVKTVRRVGYVFDPGQAVADDSGVEESNY